MTVDTTRFEIVLGAVGIAYQLWDDEDRPLGEANHPVLARMLDGDGEITADEAGEPLVVLTPCGYAGSRARKRMNVSALKQLTSWWEQVLADTRFLRGDYRRWARHDGVMTVDDAWRFATYAAALPAFLHRRADGPSARIPARVASLFKVIQGVFMTAGRMIRSGTPFETVVEPASFLAFTEANDVFVAGDRACAGPEEMVLDFLSAVFADDAAADADRSLAALVGDMDRFWEYGAACGAASVVGLALGEESRAWRERLDAVTTEPPRVRPAVTWRAFANRLAVEPGAAEPVEETVAAGLELEAWVLRALGGLHARAMAALGIEAGAPVGVQDLARLHPEHPTAVLASLLGVADLGR